MTYLELSDSTARTARSHIPIPPTLPEAALSPSRSAAALCSAQRKEHLLIDATVRTLATHLASIARFADSACETDAELAKALRRD